MTTDPMTAQPAPNKTKPRTHRTKSPKTVADIAAHNLDVFIERASWLLWAYVRRHQGSLDSERHSETLRRLMHQIVDRAFELKGDK